MCRLKIKIKKIAQDWVILVVMLFDAREFEHYFTSTILKKGLRIFEKGLLEPESRNGSTESKFKVEDHVELILKKRGDKVLGYSCTCNKTSYCEHLCAALFYFQKDTLGISVKGKETKAHKAAKVTREKSLDVFLKDIEPGSLIKFVRDYAAGNPLFKETVLAYFSSGSEENAFRYYSVAVKNILAVSAASENLQQKNLDEIQAGISDLLFSHAKNKRHYNSSYYLALAILVELPVIFNARLSGDESTLIRLLEETKGTLDLLYSKGLSTIERKAWKEATLNFLKTNITLYAGVFSFLVPRLISLLNDKNECADLKRLLDRKNIKLIRTVAGLNLLEVAKLQLAIKEAELFKTAFPFKKYAQDPELLVARAELYFYSNKTDKAFKYLEENYNEVKNDFPTRFKLYSDYLISKAKEKQRSDLELHYLEENFIYAPHISSQELDRFLQLVPLKKQALAITRLIAKIKKESGSRGMDKIFAIMLQTGRLTDLVKELKKLDNKFNLVNKIAVQSLPSYSEELLSVYQQHLFHALVEAKYTNIQQPLFLLAKKYLDRLPRKTADNLVAQLLNQIEFIKPLYNFISSHYPHAN